MEKGESGVDCWFFVHLSLWIKRSWRGGRSIEMVTWEYGTEGSEMKSCCFITFLG